MEREFILVEKDKCYKRKKKRKKNVRKYKSEERSIKVRGVKGIRKEEGRYRSGKVEEWRKMSGGKKVVLI